MIIILVLFILPFGAGQGSDEGYDRIIDGEIRIGIKSNAPDGVNPLNYGYNEELNLEMHVFDAEQRQTVASKFLIDFRLVSIGSDLKEIRINMTQVDYSTFYQPKIQNIIVSGDTNHTYIPTNSTTPLIDNFKDQSESMQIIINLTGQLSTLQTMQNFPAEPISIKFNQFQPKNYDTGAIGIENWLNFTETTNAEPVILGTLVGLNTIGLAVQIFSKPSLPKPDEETLEFAKSHSTEGKIVKEGVEIAGDTAKTAKYISKDQTNKWITKFVLISGILYFVSLLLAVLRGEQILINLYQGYTLLLEIGLLSGILLTILNPGIWDRIGSKVPWAHFILIVLGSVGFVGFLLFLIPDNPNWDPSQISVSFLLITTSSIVILSIFAGYYIARSGLSWSSLVKKGSEKLNIPEMVSSILIRLTLLLFFVVLLIRLIKTIAVVITVFTSSTLSDNVYLVTLSASYLAREIRHPLQFYGLWFIFFLQAAMALFLHVRENVDDQDNREDNFEKHKDVYKLYRWIVYLMIIVSSSFLYIVSLGSDTGDIINYNEFLSPGEIPSARVLDVWNVINQIPSFKLFIELVLIIGIILGIPLYFQRDIVDQRK